LISALDLLAKIRVCAGGDAVGDDAAYQKMSTIGQKMVG
jgi:hypothetical protein